MTTSPRIDLRPGVTEPVVLMISRRQVEAFDIASVMTKLKSPPRALQKSFVYNFFVWNRLNQQRNKSVFWPRRFATV